MDVCAIIIVVVCSFNVVSGRRRADNIRELVSACCFSSEAARATERTEQENATARQEDNTTREVSLRDTTLAGQNVKHKQREKVFPSKPKT